MQNGEKWKFGIVGIVVTTGIMGIMGTLGVIGLLTKEVQDRNPNEHFKVNQRLLEVSK